MWEGTTESYAIEELAKAEARAASIDRYGGGKEQQETITS